MPPRENSRHLFSYARKRDSGNEELFLEDRDPFRYRDLPDNISWPVSEGDTLHRIAARAYSPLSRLPIYSAAQLWWVIADFQPIPIHDPTVRLVPGDLLILPSVQVVESRILQRSDD